MSKHRIGEELWEHDDYEDRRNAVKQRKMEKRMKRESRRRMKRESSDE